MTVQDKIRSMHWEKWLYREFSPFIVSLFVGGHKKEYFAQTGFGDIRLKAQLFQLGYWYASPEVWADIVGQLTIALQTKTIFDLTKSLDKFKNKSLARVREMLAGNGDPQIFLVELYGMLTLNTSYIWLAHGLEEWYKIKLHQEVPKYVKGDIDKFIGDASFPEKKNASALMQVAISQGANNQEIVERFGYLKARGFGEPMTMADVEQIRQEVSAGGKTPSIKVPSGLEQLFSEAKELVFYRTERTDVFYELLFRARPIFQKVAQKFNIPFVEFPRYTTQSLIKGEPKKISDRPVMATYEREEYLGDELILPEEKIAEIDFVKGNIAQKGRAEGVAKIVRDSNELDKVKVGDILITQMTFPAFVPAMMRAAAFVTDEGGLTCHAAIVAREMKKPCIIGTKIATKVFKDGDLVEVDAEEGMVRKI